MIEKLLGCITQPSTIIEKLNEVIDVVNNRATFEEKMFDHPEVAKAAKKAAQTGSHADLKAYLAMRRKYL